MGGPGVDDPPRGMIGGRNLPVAIVVGLALAVVFLGSLFWRPEAFVAVILVIAGLACVEVGHSIAAVGPRVSTPVLLVAVAVCVLGAHLAGTAGLLLGAVVLLLGAVVAGLGHADGRNALAGTATTVLLGGWIGVLAGHAVLLVHRQHGPVLVLAVVGAAAFTDIGGYAFGVPFGRHKIAPRVSPNKSWEGLAGGLAVAGVLGGLLLPRLGAQLTPLHGVVLALSCGLAGFVGDLAESRLKRDLGLKDLGWTLPGHGGVLDRVDSILFALPVGYYLLVL